MAQSSLAASDTPYQLGFRNYSNLYCVVPPTSFTYFNFVQSTELTTISDWNWGTSFGSPVTLSFWFRSNAPTGSQFTMCLNVYGTGVNYLAPYTVNSSGTWQYVVMTIPPPPNGTSLGYSGGGVGPYLTAVSSSTTGTLGWSTTGSQCISGTYNWTVQAGNFIHFTGIQLERGTVASPFEVRPYATELALCQRYYQQFNCTSSGGSGQTFGTGLVSTATSVYTMTPLIVPMRANSALSSNSAPNTFIIGTGASAFTPTSMSLAQASTNQVYLNWVVAAATASQPAVVQAYSTTAAFLGFNAEL